MNKQQIYTLLKALVTGSAAPLGLILARFGVADPTVQAIVEIAGILVSIAGATWLTVDKTDRNMTLDAKEIPGVQVHVDTSRGSPAPQSVKDTARDPNIKDVVPMVGGPRADTSKELP